MFPLFPDFPPKVFSFLVIRLLVCLCASSPNMLIELIFHCFPFLSVIFFILSRYLFSIPSSTSTFWFISSSCIFCFICIAFLYLSKPIPAFFLCFIIFVSYRRLLISVSYQISHPCFGFLFVFF